MNWVSVKYELPASGQEVLTARMFLDKHKGWSDLQYMVDSGQHKVRGYFEEFEWNGNGKVFYWMPIPELPKEEE